MVIFVAANYSASYYTTGGFILYLEDFNSTTLSGGLFALKRQKEPSKENSLLGPASLLMDVFSDDFATVDFREELCYHSRPKKQIRRQIKTG